MMLLGKCKTWSVGEALEGNFLMQVTSYGGACLYVAADMKGEVLRSKVKSGPLRRR